MVNPSGAGEGYHGVREPGCVCVRVGDVWLGGCHLIPRGRIINDLLSSSEAPGCVEGLEATVSGKGTGSAESLTGPQKVATAGGVRVCFFTHVFVRVCKV